MGSLKFSACCIGLVCGSLAMIQSAAACGAGKVLFEDKFASLDPSWNMSATNDTRSVGPDGLSFKMKPNTAYTYLNQTGFYDDYEVCADVVMQFDAKSNGYLGIAFWGVDNDNLYILDVSPIVGQFAVYRGQKGKFLQPIKWGGSAAIKTGTGVTNAISVAVKANHAVITINGQKVAEFNGQPPDGGSLPGVDFSTSKNDQVETVETVQNFQIRALP